MDIIDFILHGTRLHNQYIYIYIYIYIYYFTIRLRVRF